MASSRTFVPVTAKLGENGVEILKKLEKELQCTKIDAIIVGNEVIHGEEERAVLWKSNSLVKNANFMGKIRLHLAPTTARKKGAPGFDSKIKEQVSNLGENDWSWIYGKNEESIDIASVVENLSQEEVFLDRLKTISGAQEFCLNMLVAWDLDFGKLLDLSEKQNFVNQTGCWLDSGESFRLIS